MYRKLVDKHFLFLVMLLSVLIFAPFSAKHFSIDSPVSLHVSRQIALNPLNPQLGEFGRYLIPWNHTELPQNSLFYITPHPPLVQIYLIPFLSLFGENEIILNWAMFPFYLLSILYFYKCLKLLKIPHLKSLTLLFSLTPVVVINSHDIMNDIPLLAFTLASFYYMFDFRQNSRNAFFAGFFVACAILTKITGFTLLVSGIYYYLSQKRINHLKTFLIPCAIIVGFWFAHNFILYKKFQFFSNGHMKYCLGDIRYRLERMISYAGATLIFPIFPVLLAFYQPKMRPVTIAALLVSFFWSLLMIIILKYDIFSALFYALCSSSGIILIYASFKQFKLTNSLPIKTIMVHSALQLMGGLFLTLYASRYLTPVLLTFFMGFSYLLQKSSEKINVKSLLRITILISFLVTFIFSFGDNKFASIPYKLSIDVTKKYKTASIGYAGRLGYLYYMNKSGFKYIFRNSSLEGIDYLVKDIQTTDDSYFINNHKERLVPVDTFNYSLFPFICRGVKAGFFGNDRLPYQLLLKKHFQSYILYKVSSSSFQPTTDNSAESNGFLREGK